MIIKNPTDKDISIVYLGKKLSLKAGESSEFIAKDGARLMKIYPFLNILEEAEKTVIEIEKDGEKKEDKKKVKKEEKTSKKESKKESSIARAIKKISKKK